MLTLNDNYDHLIAEYNFKSIRSSSSGKILLSEERNKRKLRIKFECYISFPNFHNAVSYVDHSPVMYIRRQPLYDFVLTSLYVMSFFVSRHLCPDA